MPRKKKGYGNPALDLCATSLRKSESISTQMSVQYQIAHKADGKAKQLQYQKRLHEVTLYKELADIILSMDLRLEDAELDFLSMRLPNRKGSKESRIRLLDDVIKRSRHYFYPPIERYTALQLSTALGVIGYDTDLKTFCKGLNKKLEGILIFKIGRLKYNEAYLRTLKRHPTERVGVEVEFVVQKS